MKKIICLVLILMLMPNLVLADSAGPSILGYDAIVINKKGAKDGNKFIPYNTIVHVVDERDGYADCYYKDNYYNISLSDIVPYQEEYIPSDKDIVNVEDEDDYYYALLKKTNEEIIVFDKKGIKLSKGPASLFKNYDKIIPYGTKLKATYAVLQSKGEGYTWYYVDSEEYKGWCSKEQIIGYNHHYDILLFTDTKVVDDNNNYVFTIPKETLIEKENLYNLSDDSKYFVKYDGKEGFIGVRKNKDDYDSYIYDFDYGVKHGSNLLILRSVGITSLDGNVRTAVNSGEIINDVYSSWREPVCLKNACYYYVEYKGTKGYVKNENVILWDSYDEEYGKNDITLEQDTKLYSLDLYNYLQSGENEIITDSIKSKYLTRTIIPKNTTLTTYKYFSYYDTYNYSFSNRKYNMYLTKYNNNFGIVFIDNEETQNNNSENNNKAIIDNQSKIITKKSNSLTNNTILFGLSGALILAIVSLITIKVINKKKKKEKEENKIVDKNNNEIKEDKKESKVEEKQEEVSKVEENTISKKREVTLSDEEK